MFTRNFIQYIVTWRVIYMQAQALFVLFLRQGDRNLITALRKYTYLSPFLYNTLYNTVKVCNSAVAKDS